MKYIEYFKKYPDKVGRFVFFLYLIVPTIASIHGILLGDFEFDGYFYERFQNFIIFQNSFFNLIGLKDLYISYPEIQWDLYKYSPTFSLLFFPLAILPYIPGVIIWNLLNSLILFYGIKSIINLTDFQKNLILLFILLELLTNIQNAQSNGLIAGIIILAFSNIQKNRYSSAALLIAISSFIKPFGLVAFSLVFLIRHKAEFIKYSIIWMLVLFLLPMTFISAEHYLFLLNSWYSLLTNDHSNSYGASLMGVLNSWFYLEFGKNIVVLIGVILFLIPVIIRRKILIDSEIHKIVFLSSVLIWIIIFNHKAESPTFIIALSGIALWYFSQRKNRINQILVYFSFLLISLSPTELFPASLKENLVSPYKLKALPAIIIWFKVIYELIFNRLKSDLVECKK